MPFSYLNLEPDGARVADPVWYDTRLKTRAQRENGRMCWSETQMPLHILAAVRAQVRAVLSYLDAKLDSHYNGCDTDS